MKIETEIVLPKTEQLICEPSMEHQFNPEKQSDSEKDASDVSEGSPNSPNVCSIIDLLLAELPIGHV